MTKKVQAKYTFLPAFPNNSALERHIMRAYYQSHMWKNSLESSIED